MSTNAAQIHTRSSVERSGSGLASFSAKIVAKSKISEWRGLDRISPVVHGMGCIWREQEKDDIGIDGEIELCRPRIDGEGLIGTGKIVKVQSKSGSSYVVRDTPETFASPVSEKDLAYWRGLNVPIIYVVFHPEDDRLYWKDVKAHLVENPNAFTPPLRIEFDKEADRFDQQAYDALCDLCELAPERVSTAVGETLFTNVLEVDRMPGRIWVTAVLPEKRTRFHDRLTGIIPPYVFKARTIVTLTDPNETTTALSSVIDEGSTESFELEDWLGQSEENEADLRALMNSLLHRHLMGLELAYENRKPRIYFFNRGLAEDSPLRRTWTSPRTGRTQSRLVAKHFSYGTLKKLTYFKHQAVTARIDRLGSQWVVVIDPVLHYTDDGVRASNPKKIRSHMIRARAQQYNDVYLNNVLFWSQLFARAQASFELRVGGEAVAEVNGVPTEVAASFSIQTPPAKGRGKS